MNELKPFIFESNEVKTVIYNNEPLFNAKSVGDCLEISNITDSLQALDEDEVIKLKNSDLDNTEFRYTLNNKGENFLTEAGLYGLIMISRKPKAKAFKRWVKHDVLPSIRKHGIYATPTTIEDMIKNPQFAIKLLQELEAEQKKSKDLAISIDEENSYASVKRVCIITGYKDNCVHLPLTRTCKMLEIDTKEVIDGNYDTVKSYPAEAWRLTYGVDIKKLIENKNDKALIEETKMKLISVPKTKTQQKIWDFLGTIDNPKYGLTSFLKHLLTLDKPLRDTSLKLVFKTFMLGYKLTTSV